VRVYIDLLKLLTLIRQVSRKKCMT